MWFLYPYYSYLQNVLHFILLYLVLVAMQNAESRSLGRQLKYSNNNSSISAIFVFGDSTVDSGNNNYIPTAVRSNFYPYGKDFPNHIPTGRFTNGRLVTDFIASYIGLKDSVPPYLNPTLSIEDLMTGVCFASAGTGFDPLTAQFTGVIPVEKQIQYFREYKTKMEMQIGKQRTKKLISKAAFLISAGTNDFLINYYGVPFRRQTYTVSAYKKYIIQLGQQFLEGLLQEGAKKIAFVGLPPIGCVPAAITLVSDNAFTNRGCIGSLSSVAADYNRMLQNNLKTVQLQNHGAKITYIDIYHPFDDIMEKSRQYGFEEVDVGCCGTGLIEISFLCNPKSLLCSDASKYVFWDSVHPTEAAYWAIFQAVRPVVDQFVKD